MPDNGASHDLDGSLGAERQALLLRRMERLIEVGQTLTSTLELKQLLHRIVDASRELTDCAGASIMLVEPSSGELRFRATTSSENSHLADVAVPREGSLAGWVATHGQPLVVNDVHGDPRWHAQVDRLIDFNTRSLIGVPLLARGKTIGVLEAVNKRNSHFSPDDVSLLQWLAAQAAAAIVNARLFEQSDLVSELVHELRTPLTALMATSQLLLRPELPAKTHTELVETLQRETQRLSTLTTSFLDMVKLEAGRMPFTVERFDPATLIDECVVVMQPQAEQQAVALTAEVAADLPALESDRGKLKQVLLNLLSNALKYNRPGGRVTVSASAGSDGLHVRVADTGPGIPPEAQPHIFERFYRVRDSEGYVSGTGLGLPIARRIVEALGGAIGFETEPGAGTTFYFDLPLVMGPAGREPA